MGVPAGSAPSDLAAVDLESVLHGARCIITVVLVVVVVVIVVVCVVVLVVNLVAILIMQVICICL